VEPHVPDPTIDVVIPAYNAGRFIERALLSVRSQTLRVQQIIVVDDGSTDDTAAQVQLFASRYPDVSVVCISQDNAGVSAARNRGLHLVDADFVALLDADDEWVPSKLAQQMALFDADPGQRLAMVYCDYDLIGGGSEPLARASAVPARLRGDVHRALLKGNLISGSCSAVVVRRQVLKDVGDFDETLVCAEDWDLWLRISEKYLVDYVPGILVHIRQHRANSQSDSLRMLGGELRFVDKLQAREELSFWHVLRLRAKMQRLMVGLPDYSPWRPSVRLSERLESAWTGIFACGYNKVRDVVHNRIRRQ
jgi:glycosyltransferase involved in cell wall biosynthesis